MYIQQNPLFSFNELMSFQPKSRLELIFLKSTSPPLLQRCLKSRLSGRTDIPNKHFY